MYRVSTPGYDKQDPVKRWSVPDRVFFACGACHILAYAFLERFGAGGMRPVWVKPAKGHSGHHIFVESGSWVFDYHGYAERSKYLDHTFGKARRQWPGWDAELIGIAPEALVSERKSRTYDGLWLREPQGFLHDALPRARRFLSRFPEPPGPSRTLRPEVPKRPTYALRKCGLHRVHGRTPGERRYPGHHGV